jgi:hypothetical protein
VDGPDLVALIGEHRPRGGVVGLDLVDPVIDLTGPDELVPGMGERGQGVVEAQFVLRRHVLADNRLLPCHQLLGRRVHGTSFVPGVTYAAERD